MWNRFKLKLDDNAKPLNARCGRCGLWSEYPEHHREKKWQGVCIWYQIRLDRESVFEARHCEDFFERIPGMVAMDHMDYKIKRDNLGDAFVQAQRAKRLAYTGIVLSVLGLLSKLLV